MKNTIEYLQKVKSSHIIMSSDFEKLANKKPWSCQYGYFVKMPINMTLGIVSTI